MVVCRTKEAVLPGTGTKCGTARSEQSPSSQERRPVRGAIRSEPPLTAAFLVGPVVAAAQCLCHAWPGGQLVWGGMLDERALCAAERMCPSQLLRPNRGLSSHDFKYLIHHRTE